MSKTLVLIFHPELARSRANAALRGAIADIDGVDAVDVSALYPDGDIDAEVRRLRDADRIVLQFPVHWYGAPPRLQAT